MGLPLFVAPVESDIARKPNKPTSTSPPRSSIRRHPYTAGSGDRANAHRTARLLEHLERRRPLPRAVESALNSEGVSPELRTAAQYIRNGFLTQDDLTRGADFDRDSRRLTLMQSMDRRFGSDWRDRDWEYPQQDLNSDWWITEPRLWGGRARLTRLGPGITRVRTHTRTSQPVMSITGAHTGRRVTPNRVSPLSRPLSPQESTRHETSEDINGLGDRNRSVSPEGWDTLFTTLTPDPQPPSASSSFVSTVASQSAGASSHTSFSEQRRANESVPEPPCDTVSDNSDEEGMTPRAPLRASNPVRFNVPEYELDGPTMLRAVPGGIRPDSYVRPDGPDDFWIAQLTTMAAPVRSDRSPRNSEGSAISGNNEGMGGWQRIVRSLADREDIPDEWWAEAGLSRNLAGERS